MAGRCQDRQSRVTFVRSRPIVNDLTASTAAAAAAAAEEDKDEEAS